MLVRPSALIAALVVIALTLAACRSGPFGELREVEREQAEAVLTEALRDAEPAADVSEIKIAGRDIWAVAAEAVLTAHPACVSVFAVGSASYDPAEMGVVEGLGDDSPLPDAIAQSDIVELWGDPDRTYVNEQRIVQLWLLPQRLGYLRYLLFASEFVPKSDGVAGAADVEWREAAEVTVVNCYDAAGEELPNFDRAALPPLDLSQLDIFRAVTEVALRVSLPGEELCQSGEGSAFEWGVLDENPPEYSGVVTGSDPTPEMLDALRRSGEEPDNFELWYVTPRFARFASLDDREQGSTVFGRVAEVAWLGFDAEGTPVWGRVSRSWLSLCK